MLSHFTRLSLLLAALSASVHAHGVLTNVAGGNGIDGVGFGVLASTPRDGTRANPFQQDSSIIRDNEITRGTADVCGRTRAGGNNDVAKQLVAASDAGLPSAESDGSVKMTLHQVNGDGAGPYTCEVSADATGQDFVAMTVTTNVPGKNSRSNAKATDFPLVAQMPANVACSGGPNGDACLVRCRNAARAGPFGGCVAVTNADGGAAGNQTAPAAAAGKGKATKTPPAASTTAAGAAPAAASGEATPAAASGDATAATTDATTGTAGTATTGTNAVKGKSAKVARLNRLVRTVEEDQAIAEAEEEEEDTEFARRLVRALARRASIEEEQAAAEAEEEEQDWENDPSAVAAAIAAAEKAAAQKKRWIKSRVVGRRRAYEWI